MSTECVFRYSITIIAGLIRNLGNVLFTNYVLPFEIASILFLSAMIGAVIIGKKT